jgi:RecB family exonuclease|tara:strand:- start:215 stop:1159 length:945 start_codon:yes stop_codon:yes gene_type:complete
LKFNPNDTAFFENKEYHDEELLKSYENSTYAWTPDMDKILRVSKSSLGTHGFCQYQYKLQYIHQMPVEENYTMVRGTNVHAIVEYFWDHVDEVMPEVLSHIEKDNQYAAMELLRSVVPKPPEPYAYGEEAVIEQWLEWQFKRLLLLDEGKDWKPVGNEVSFHARREVEVDGVSVPIHMRGFIDTIFSDGEGGFVLMELKTGKWNLKKAKSMREEMQFYRLALEEGQFTKFLPVTHWAWEFPNGQNNGGVKAEWEIEEIGTRKTRYAPKTVENKLKKLVKSHIEDSFPPEPHARKCEWCDYMDMCPAWNDITVEV